MSDDPVIDLIDAYNAVVGGLVVGLHQAGVIDGYAIADGLKPHSSRSALTKDAIEALQGVIREGLAAVQKPYPPHLQPVD